MSIRAFAVAALFLAVAPAEADTLTRVTDLRPGGDDGVPDLDAAVLGATLFFVGILPGGGRAIWQTNGSAPPSFVLGSDGANPQELVAWSGKLYFCGGPSSDRELWSYDPATGDLVEAVDTRPSGNANPQHLAVFGGKLCFAAFSEDGERELFCWPGSGGAQLVELAPGPTSSFPRELVATATNLYVVASVSGDERLWRYDGIGSPVLIEPPPGESYDLPGGLEAIGGEIYFAAFDATFRIRLWRHGGGPAPAELLSSDFEATGFLGRYRDRIVTSGLHEPLGVTAQELWRLGALGLARLSPGVGVDTSDAFSVLDGALFTRGFVSGGAEWAVYRYCGAGDVMPVIDPRNGSDPNPAGERTLAFGGRLYFAGEDAVSGRELWTFESSHLFCDDFESTDTGWWSTTTP